MATAVASSAPEVQPGFDFRAEPCPGGRLEEVLARHDGELAQWRRERLQALQQEAEQAARQLGRERAGLQDLLSDLGATAQLTQQAAQVHAEGVRSGEAAQEARQAAMERCEVAASARQKLREVDEVRGKELRAEEAVLQEQEATQAERAAELDSFLALYTDCLGLTLARAGPQEVRVVFTLLDRNAPAREFAFALGLTASAGGRGDDAAGYHVGKCCPNIPAWQVEGLLDRLNAAGGCEASALPAFVCGMRRLFRAHAEAAP